MEKGGGDRGGGGGDYDVGEKGSGAGERGWMIIIYDKN